MLGVSPASQLSGLKVLVVEDQYLVADEHEHLLRSLGAEVMGPAPSVQAALQLLADQTPDLALLDVNLEQEKVFALAEELERRETPFLFVTGYEGWVIPSAYRGVPIVEKPLSARLLLRAVGELSRAPSQKDG